MKKYFLLLTITCLLVHLEAQNECTPPLGATLAPITWNQSSANWFVDYMKMSKPEYGPVSGPWDQGSPATDAEGWPTEPFSIWVKLAIYPQDTGVYHLEFEGFANLFVFGTHTITDQVYDPATNKTTAKLHIVLNETQIALQFGAPMSPTVRHIRLIAPGFDPTNHPTFHPDWVEHVSRFPVLRFMTWNAANFNTTVQWADRNTTESPTQCLASFPTNSPSPSRGVAWEYVAELANLTGSDIWINIPINANDDYVQKLAQFLKSTLQPSIKIYVEYANEVWNSSTYPYQQNISAATAEVGAGNSNLNADGETNASLWASRRYARRTKEIGGILAQAFGQDALFKRIFPVLGHQVVSPGYFMKDALSFMKNQYGLPQNYYWSIAGAPFLDGNGLPQTGLTRDKYFEYMQSQSDRMFGDTENFLDAGLSFATYYNLRYMAHEAGTDSYFYGNQFSQALKDTVAAAQNDPRMKTLIENYLNNWFRYGGRDGVFTWFVAGGTDWHFGDTYGLVNDRLHLNNVKTQAIDQILANECPKQFAGHPIPGTIDARKFVQYPDNWDANPYNTMMFQGNTHQYLLNVADSCTYQYYLVAQNPVFGASQFEILLNDVAFDTLVIPEITTPGFDTFPIGAIVMRKGVNTLRLRYLTWCYGTHSLIFNTTTNCSVSTQTVVASPLLIFPNPITEGFFVQPNEELIGSKMLTVRDVLGRLVLQKIVNLTQDKPLWVESDLPTGIYHVALGAFSSKMVVAKR